ncbi:hypothetical protein ABIE26_004987 [Pedobacter africanus]|uniref:Uncharacterized protein n=1 Tax=Pedobacter africanus TaxID=151894 RepID=A0ACC6L3N4_9SPHI|nr:hypothetical protein [Pedobacter africanus]MDR6786268.1 hypothetical protein [Pedobacter africanus]
MKKLSVYLIGTLFVLGILACKKDKVKTTDEESSEVVALVRPKGVSTGAAVTRRIGPAGGVIASSECGLSINIPAGALKVETIIGIEPITRTNIAGAGKSFRLSPHDVQFEKPVSLTYAFSVETDSIAMIETFGFSYQLVSGAWKYVGASSYDVQGKTVTFKTTHFSDWSMMNRVSLSPLHASLEPGDKQEIKALIYTESKYEDLLVPLTGATGTEPGYPVGTPVPLPAKYIKSWDLTGPGNIISSNGNKITYQAPATVNGFTNATVSLNLNAPVTGTFMLLSNIEIMGDGWAELNVSNGKFPVTPAVKSGHRWILSNPDAEGGGQFLLTWNGGVGTYAYDLTPTGNKFHFLIGNGGYTSAYVDQLLNDLVPSGGSINITRMDNKWVEGNFTVPNAGIGPLLIQTTSINGRFRARVYNP